MSLTRLWIDIEGDLIDIWHLKDVRKGAEQDTDGEYWYTLTLNPDAGIASEVKNRKFRFRTVEQRDAMLKHIKEKITNAPGMYFLGENDDKLMEEILADRKKKKEQQQEDTDFDEEWEEDY